jgi:hypothetical protein
MKAILIMELKGFGDIATALAKRMDSISLTSERVRGVGREIVNQVIQTASQENLPLEVHEIGGDTWFLTFETVETSIFFGCSFLQLIRKLAFEQAILFLKPSIAVNYCDPKFQGDRFLDDVSIRTYRTADKGEPFDLYVLEEALSSAKQIEGIRLAPTPSFDGKELVRVDWHQLHLKTERLSIAVPLLLLDSEVVFSNSAEQAIKIVRSQQVASKEIIAFGGPVPIEIRSYEDYIKETLSQIREDQGKTWIILSYIPVDDPFNSYCWIELCRRLSIKYSQRYAFKAFPLMLGQLRPFSYQIFDRNVVHLGLRSFSAVRGTPIMSSAMLLKNKRIVARFYDEFMENWRRITPLTDQEHGAILSALKGLTDRIKKEALERVDTLLSDPGYDVRTIVEEEKHK